MQKRENGKSYTKRKNKYQEKIMERKKINVKTKENG